MRRDDDTYRFGYRWRIHGPLESIFHYVTDARTFVDWFPIFKRVIADEPTGPLHVGSHVTAHVKALLPYVLDWDITVTQYDPPNFIETAVKLSLSGRFNMHGYVRYRFNRLPGNLVQVINEQAITADRPLPRLLHPLAQLAFAANHNWAMHKGAGPLQDIVHSRPNPSLRPVAQNP